MKNIDNYIVEKLHLSKDTKMPKNKEALWINIRLDNVNYISTDRIIIHEECENKIRYSYPGSKNIYSLLCRVNPLGYYEDYSDVASTYINLVLPINAALDFIDIIQSYIALTSKTNEYSLKGFPFDKWVYTTIKQKWLDNMVISENTLEKLKKYAKEWSK